MLFNLSTQQVRLSHLVEGSRRTVLLLAAVCLLSLWSTATVAAGPNNRETERFDIPQQRADRSLITFAEQADITLIFPFELARDKTTNRLVGSYHPNEAIQLLLDGTGLKPTFSSDGHINIALAEVPVAEGEYMNVRKKGLWAALAQIFIVSGAAAQEVSETGVPAPQTVLAEAAIEEIVVTARKRAESLQEVPVAVSALDAELINRQQLDNVADVSRYMPNVTLDDGQFTAGQLVASIRGTNFSEVEKSFESSVGVIIDGMFLGTGTGASVQMLDVEQVEVLRGPQGTLYGRNTIGGTISFRRTRPTGEFGYKVNARFGEHDRQQYGLVVNLPETAGFSTKLYAFSKKADLAAKLEDVGTEDGQDWFSTGFSVLWEPTDTFSAQLTFDYVDDDSHYERVYDLTLNNADSVAAGIIPEEVPGVTTCDIFGAFHPSTCLAGNFDVQDAEDFELSFGDPRFPFQNTMKTYTGILELNVDFENDTTLTSITAYHDISDQLIEPNVGARPLTFAGDGVWDAFWLERDADYFQFSQELRLASSFSGPVNFVAGVYYLRSHYELDGVREPAVPPSATTSGSPSASVFLAGAPVAIIRPKQDVDALAGFGEVYWDVSERLRLTGGLRYSYESKNFFMDRWFVDAATGATLPQFTFDDDDNWSEATWRLIADYSLADDIMVYGSYSRGFRSGGFDGRATTLAQLQNPFDPETVDTFETGLRMDLLDGELRLNPTIFFTKYDDKQEERVFSFIGPGGVPETVTVTVNAAKAEIWGIELESIWAPTERLLFRGSFGYLDAEYKTFDSINPISLAPEDIADTARLRRVPEINYSIGAEYRMPIGAGELIATVHHSYTDEFFSSPVQRQQDPLGRDIAPEDHRTDFFLTYDRPIGDNGTHLTATAFMKDAFGDEVRSALPFNAGLFWFGQRVAERQWGLEFTLAH